jgi:hypothetical protein
MSAISTPSSAYPDSPGPVDLKPAGKPRLPLARLSESGSALLAMLLLALGGYAAVLAGWQVPPLVQLALALTGLVLVPGLALAHLLLRDHEAEWPEWIALGFGAGIAIQAVMALAAHLTRTAFYFEIWLLPALGLALLLIRFGRRGAEPGTTLAPVSALPAWIVAVLAMGAAALWTAVTGAPLAIDNDSYDHIASIGRMAESGVVFPLDAYYADAGVAGADPRKGLYHVVLALLVRATQLDPVVVWKLSSALLAPLLVLVAYVLTRRVAQSRAAGAVAAVLMLLVYGGGIGTLALREAPYSTRVADALSMLAIWSLLAVVTRGGWRTLLLTAVLVFAAVTTHVFSAVYLGLAGIALVLGVLVAYRQLPISIQVLSKLRMIGWAAAAGLASVAACAPYLWLRWKEAYAPADPVHLEPQGLLYWWQESFFTVSPWPVWEWLWWPGIALILCLPFLWHKRSVGVGPVFLVSITVLVLAVILNPLLLPLAHQTLGYLVMRLVWCIPLVTGLAAAIVFALQSLESPATPGIRQRAGFVLVVICLSLIPPGLSAVTAITRFDERRLAEESKGSTGWLDLAAYLRTQWDTPRVLLSDPSTSYSLAAYTRHYVTTLMPQHASPNDPDGARRPADARDVLSPFVGMPRTMDLLRRYGVDAVIVNQRFPEAFADGPWVNQPELYDETLSKFRAQPELFEEVWSEDGAHVFALTAAARDGELPVTGEAPELPFASDQSVETATPDGNFLQHGTAIEPLQVRPGEMISLATSWSRKAGPELRPGAYWVAVRLEADVPRSVLYHRLIAKPYRKAMEFISGETWKLESNHVPLEGYLGPDCWPEGQHFEDRYPFYIPENAAPGEYRVRVKMMRLPRYPNTRVEDFFLDHNASDGEVVGSVVVGARR